MTLTVNGETRQVPGRLTVATLLTTLDLRGPCAVEVNRELIPKPDHERITLADGDRIEIVTLVGGG